MQRRNSTKSRAPLRRKSTSSVKSVQLVHIHPDIAEHDAQNAAIQAFARARERSNNGIIHWPPPRCSERPASGRHQTSPETHQNRSAVRGQQSVRFVQPKTSQAKPQEDTPQYTPSRQSSGRSRTTRPRSQTKLTSNASAAGMVFAAKGTAGDYINSLITGEDYYTPEDDIASMPSSFRRLRKSKSIHTGSEKMNAFDIEDRTPGSANRRSCVSHQTWGHQNNGIRTDRVLRASRSTSLLRASKVVSASSDCRSNAQMIHPSSDSILTTSHPRIVNSHSSILRRPKSVKTDKFLKKTLRDVSSETTLLSTKDHQDGSLRLKARTASHNFKHKLKNFFSIAKPDNENTLLPPQQVEARRSHCMAMDDLGYSFRDSHSRKDRESTTISRVTSGVPSLHAVPSEQQLRSRQGSLESLPSQQEAPDEKSRVTSWSDSDANTYDTVNSSRGEWEKQRLSVIKENGHHVSSASHPRRPLYDHGAGSSDAHASISGQATPSFNINGQRIYSALMKRHESTRDARRSTDEGCQRGLEDLVDQGIIPTRTSSKRFAMGVDKAAASIKHVVVRETPYTDVSRTVSGTTVIHRNPSVTNEVPNTSKVNTLSTSVSAGALATAATPGLLLCNATVALSTRTVTSPNVGRQAPFSRTLTERGSAFFGSPTCHLFRTQSPYRRAVRGSMQAAAEATPPKSPEFNPWIKSLSKLRIRCPSTCESDYDLKLACDESVYSEDAELINNTPRKGGIPETMHESVENHGNVTIFLDPPKYKPPTSESAQRAASSTSSTEWKTWLSANTSGLNQKETPFDCDKGMLQAYKPSKIPRMSGHIREYAQISDEDNSTRAKQKLKITVKPNLALMASQYKTRECPTTPHTDPRVQRRDIVPGGVAKTSPKPAKKAAQLRKGIIGSTTSGICGEECSSQTKPLLQTRSLTRLGTHNQNIVLSERKVLEQDHLKLHTSSLSSSPIAKISGSENSRPQSFLSEQIKVENCSPNVAGNIIVGSPRSGGCSAEDNPDGRGVGSRHMVESFIDSRRRRIAGSDDTGAFI